jgi:hypothetical protein
LDAVYADLDKAIANLRLLTTWYQRIWPALQRCRPGIKARSDYLKAQDNKIHGRAVLKRIGILPLMLAKP